MNATRTGRRVFLRHFVEMLIAMFAGMLVSRHSCSRWPAASDAPGSVRVMLMGFDMTVPMVAWMSYRGHSRARNAEMAASMIVPTPQAASRGARSAVERCRARRSARRDDPHDARRDAVAIRRLLHAG